MKLKDIENKKVIILGFGKEGEDSFSFLQKRFPGKKLAVGDEKELKDFSKEKRALLEKADLFLGKRCLPALSRFDVVVKSPGFPPSKLKGKLKKGAKVTSQADLFLQNTKGKVVGVTGSLGKSTTSSLIFHVLREGGKKVFLVGNIGKPALSLLEKDKKENIYVFELSSYQLRTVTKSPEVAVLLNIFREHLDWHKTMKDYVSSKEKITKFQTEKDFLIYNKENDLVRKIARRSKAKKIPISASLPKGFGEKKIPLKKEYLLNVKAAIEVGLIFDLEKEEIGEGIQKFKPLPHRLEYVGRFKGIDFYNDSLSTVPEASLKALEALGKKVQTIFLGGYERGQRFDDLIKAVKESKIENIVLFPETGKRIKKEVKGFNILETEKMEKAVKFAYTNTDRGRVVLLSPASPSFGLFTDYKERGNLFKKYVKKYGKKKKN